MITTTVTFRLGDKVVASVEVNSDSADTDNIQIAAAARDALLTATAEVNGEVFTDTDIEEWWA